MFVSSHPPHPGGLFSRHQFKAAATLSTCYPIFKPTFLSEPSAHLLLLFTGPRALMRKALDAFLENISCETMHPSTFSPITFPGQDQASCPYSRSRFPKPHVRTSSDIAHLTLLVFSQRCCTLLTPTDVLFGKGFLIHCSCFCAARSPRATSCMFRNPSLLGIAHLFLMLLYPPHQPVNLGRLAQQPIVQRGALGARRQTLPIPHAAANSTAASSARFPQCPSQRCRR